MTTRDMTAANWARTYARLQRSIVELREHGCQVIEPTGFETAPELRPTGRPDALKPGETPRRPLHPLL